MKAFISYTALLLLIFSLFNIFVENEIKFLKEILGLSLILFLFILAYAMIRNLKHN